MERTKTEINFSMNVSQENYNQFTPEQRTDFINAYLQNIQCILTGAILAAKDNLDFTVKINANILEQIEIPEQLTTLLKTKNMIISVIFIGSGDGRFFN